MAITFITDAQNQKPTKAQTVDFINRTLELSIGSKYNYTYTTRTSFDYETYIRESVMKAGSQKVVVGNYKEEYSLLKWENLLINNFQLKNCDFGDNGICEIWISFSSQISFRETKSGKSIDNTDKTNYVQTLAMLIPSEKFESIKKACIRLSEIAKEENKDPFQN